MIDFKQMALILEALPDPVFIFTRSGKYVAVFGGRDTRYYHDGTGLIGLYIQDLIKPEKANWFLEQIAKALDTQKLMVVEYELSNRDVKGLLDEGPADPIWFEGRIQALSFQVDENDVVLWVASNISERHHLEVKLRELSDTDQLTGLYNRRRLEHDLTLHHQALTRYAVPTSVCMFDLDNLKIINDTQGHHVGDQMIQAAANICRTALRKNDTACRFGGDEFVIALPNTAREQAMQFAERLHGYFKQELDHFSVGNIVVTASIGITSMVPEDTTHEDTLKRADRALYEAKKTGKNRIVWG
ncbi:MULTISPECIES: GGDEF domain-containing protein [unclassified Pseudomonas]|uniref:GGDEF domain-containing protein n=1 Tax=unclassified Pseudomonas TaxID=196821 RepID=UPI001295FDBC|nr:MULTISPECIES: GGDEF domain-containing protein [unclassified Pseudomonas]MQT54705.1 diguanylate cyclase [Pseudomonas sp. FSL R10-2398]MQU03648.1 diguanylate cyclase [Pseudomonas sp. FSL R10-2245]MQU14500.1 diguanylate cyclase [Pseudomonas sp. FSL R10-2189]MQU40054.1 diguanylate cyclase [Pseudomonas sp. FSL R10-2172]